MRLQTDDDVYAVDAVWLGPERLTFPWRARYSAYGIGLFTFILLFGLERQIGISLSFFSVAWTLLGTIMLTRWVGRLIDPDRPLTHLFSGLLAEITTPRQRTSTEYVVLRCEHVRTSATRPRPAPGSRSERIGAQRAARRARAA